MATRQAVRRLLQAERWAVAPGRAAARRGSPGAGACIAAARPSQASLNLQTRWLNSHGERTRAPEYVPQLTDEPAVTLAVPKAAELVSPAAFLLDAQSTLWGQRRKQLLSQMAEVAAQAEAEIQAAKSTWNPPSVLREADEAEDSLVAALQATHLAATSLEFRLACLDVAHLLVKVASGNGELSRTAAATGPDASDTTTWRTWEDIFGMSVGNILLTARDVVSVNVAQETVSSLTKSANGFGRLVDTLRGRPAFRRAIVHMAHFVRDLARQEDEAGALAEAAQLGKLARAVHDFRASSKALLESLAAGHSATSLVEAVADLRQVVMEHPRMRAFVMDLAGLLREVLRNPNALADPDRALEAHAKLSQAREMLAPVRPLLIKVGKEAIALTSEWITHVPTHRLNADARVTLEELFAPPGDRDIRRVMAAVVYDQIKHVRLPAVYGGQGDLRWIVSELELEPIELHADQITVDGWRNGTEPEHLGDVPFTLQITISGWHATARDAAIYVRHALPPRSTSQGRIHLVFGGGGATLELNMQGVMRQRSLPSRNTPTYPSTVPVSIRCDIDGIVAANPTNFHVMPPRPNESSSLLANLAKNVCESDEFRRQMEQTIVNATRDWVLELDTVLEPYLQRVTL